MEQFEDDQHSKWGTSSLSSAKQGDENSRQKLRFKLSADGNHEHYLVDARTEVGISESLLLSLREKWWKQPTLILNKP
jgi:hypothetical protein